MARLDCDGKTDRVGSLRRLRTNVDIRASSFVFSFCYLRSLMFISYPSERWYCEILSTIDHIRGRAISVFAHLARTWA